MGDSRKNWEMADFKSYVLIPYTKVQTRETGIPGYIQQWKGYILLTYNRNLYTRIPVARIGTEILRLRRKKYQNP